jgi:hypothetical protein
MRVRYRILDSHFDRAGYLRSIADAGEEQRRENAGPFGPLGARGGGEDLAAAAELSQAVIGLADTPRIVEARDGEATLEEVRAMLAHDELHLRDLVDVGRGWEPVDACPELFAQAVDAEDRAAQSAIWTKVLVALGVVLAGALLYAACS